MDTRPAIPINEIVDNLPVTGGAILMLGLCFGAMVTEGYNLGVPALAAAGIVRAFGVTRAQLAPIFSVALFGMLVGTLVNGWLGDRFGRKRGILLATAIIGIGSFGCGLAENLDQLFWLRLLVGLGLGGLLPNSAALLAEYAPKKVRAAFITYAFMGITAGGTLPGFVSVELGGGNWRGLFFTGGVLTLLILPAIFFFLPESPKFLALQPDRWPELRRWLFSFNVVAADNSFVSDESSAPFSLGALFAGRLRWITPALWLAYILIMMVNYFINSWLTLVLTDMGFSAGEAASITSLYYVGGICGGIIMGIALDRVGPATLGFYALLGAVVTFAIGFAGGSVAITSLLVFLIGVSLLGILGGLSSVTGLVYPTPMRSKAAGFAYAIGRLGGITGPMVAGFLIANNSGVFALFQVPVVALVVAVPCFFIITRAWTGRFRGRGTAVLDGIGG